MMKAIMFNDIVKYYFVVNFVIFFFPYDLVKFF